MSRTIEERTILFHRMFPGKHIKPWRLRAIYRANLIKLKLIRITKMPIYGSDGRYDNMQAEMSRRVQDAVDRGRKLIWLDETLFTKHTAFKQEWSRRRFNFHVPCESMGVKYTAVIAAISEGCGFECIELHDTPVTGEIFAKYVKKLFNKNKERPITLIMDNLRAHKKDCVYDMMREKGIEWVWVVPYSPDLNGIEFPFAGVKKAFKEQKL